MKPGLLEFREVALPALMDLVPGCYVDYTRTGHRYRIYTAPQLKKQARSNSYGGAFVYQSVQLYDASKELEYCPFRDLVTGDSRIHFSTQPSISTFEGCDGLARRFEACLVDQYGEGSWKVRIATTSDGVTPDFYNLMMDAREFTVSGVNILGCLDKIYEIWPEVGWIYTVELVDGEPTNTIIIGGAGLNTNEGTYAYGKGKGLKSLTRTAANADEIANRIYAYGSSRNMLPGWYNNQSIKDAQSVDIQNLMIPVSEWGLTDGERDAAKAYVENDDSIAKNGLRPATVYFDGSGEYPEIYPTIRNKTIGDVWEVMSSSDQYYPNPGKYSSGDRIDTLLSAQSTFDSGLSGNAPGSANVEMGDTPFFASGTFEMLAGLTYYPFYHYQGTWTPETAGIQTVAWRLDLSGQVQLEGIEKVVVSVQVKDPSYQGPIILASDYELTPDTNGVVTLSGKEMYAEKVKVSAVTYNVFVDISVYMTAQSADKIGVYTADGNVGFSVQNYRKKTFTITLRQLGFDINAQSALGDGKSIAMRSGKCQGRTFTIKNVQYDSTNDAWTLECFRSEDESLSQWFPNTDYPVRGKEANYDGDEFVLLDIAMPSLYIGMAENDLYQAALDLLSDTAMERWQYVPEIDAKFMVENSRTIRSGEYMAFLDIDVIESEPGTVSYFKTSEEVYLLTSNGEKIRIDDGSGAVMTALVDSIVINEGESSIPTYKVTLRDKKRKTWTESKGAEAPSSKSVGSITASQVESSSSFESQFFTLDESGNITLKPQYSNLWVPGWLAAGGIGEGGGGGGSTVTVTQILSSGTIIATITVDGLATDLYAPSGGGGGTTVSWGTKVPNYSRVLTVSGTSETVLLDGALTPLTEAVNAIDWFSVVTVDNQPTLRLNPRYAGMWADGWVAAGGIGSGGGGGGGSTSLAGLSDVSVGSVANNDLLTYDTSINGGTWVPLSRSSLVSGLLSGYLPLSGGTLTGTIQASGWSINTGGLGEFNTIQGKGSNSLYIGHSNIEAFVYLQEDTYLKNQAIMGGTSIYASENLWIIEPTGAATFTSLDVVDGNTTTNNILPSLNETYNLGSTTARWAELYAVDANLSGDLTMSANKHIDIGPLRIEYDSNAKALHITKASSNDPNNYGIYADGFVSAGGVA